MLNSSQSNIPENKKFRLGVSNFWKLVEDIVLTLAVIALSLPFFIVIHRNIPDLNWAFNIDRILIYLLILSAMFLLVKYLRRIFLIICFLFILLFFVLNLTQHYTLNSFSDDYRAMIESMENSPQPQQIIINTLNFNSQDAQILKSIDYTNPTVRNFALEAVNKNFKNQIQDKRYRQIIQCFAVFKEINSHWNYVNDPKGREYYAKASESITTLAGDCDDHSILMAACIKVIGGTPRLIYTQNHLYPEILIGDQSDLESVNYLIRNKLFPQESKGKILYYHTDAEGKIWMNLDYTAKYPGGPFLSNDVLGIINVE